MDSKFHVGKPSEFGGSRPNLKFKRENSVRIEGNGHGRVSGFAYRGNEEIFKSGEKTVQSQLIYLHEQVSRQGNEGLRTTHGLLSSELAGFDAYC